MDLFRFRFALGFGLGSVWVVGCCIIFFFFFSPLLLFFLLSGIRNVSLFLVCEFFF